jgi:hypothetical protein
MLNKKKEYGQLFRIDSKHRSKTMVDFRLLNGKPRATLIQRFDGSVLLLGPNGVFRKRVFEL